jgi:hypothetical protein
MYSDVHDSFMWSRSITNIRTLLHLFQYRYSTLPSPHHPHNHNLTPPCSQTSLPLTHCYTWHLAGNWIYKLPSFMNKGIDWNTDWSPSKSHLRLLLYRCCGCSYLMVRDNRMAHLWRNYVCLYITFNVPSCVHIVQIRSTAVTVCACNHFNWYRQYSCVCRTIVTH